MKLLSHRLISRTASDLSRRPIRGSRLLSRVIPCAFLHHHLVSPQYHSRLGRLVSPLSFLQSTSIGGRTFSTDIEDIEIIELGMPALSPTMEMGSIVTWNKKVGDPVTTGEVLAEIETDKATVAFESTEDGYLAAIYVEAGIPDIPVNTIIGIMVEEEEEIELAQAQAKPKLSVTSEPPVSETSTIEKTPTIEEISNTGKVLSLSPAVGFLINTYHVDPISIIGTGPSGRILKGDVLKALANNTAKIIEPKAPSVSTVTATGTPAKASPDIQFEQRSIGRGLREFVDIPHTNIRKAIASQVSQSKSTIPHNYTAGKIRMDSLLQLRESLRIGDQEPPSIDDFIIKAVALACRTNPGINSIYDSATQTTKSCDTIDIGVAVATDTGFITPILEKADTLRITQISTKVKDMVTKVQTGETQPEECIGGNGSFTISNLGMFGVANFSTVIKFPETCNLAVGESQTQVVVGKKGPIQTAIMQVQLSCDERAVDNHTAAEWLSSFRGYMENPNSMLSG